MFYLCGAGLVKHYRNDIEAIWSILYIVGFEKIAGSSLQFCFLGECNNRLGRCEAFVRSGFYLNEDNSTIGSDHNKIDFAGFTREIAGELLEAFSFQKPFTALFTPLAEQLPVGQ